MNKAHLVAGETGKALYLSGHDDWLEVARDPALDITGEALTLSFLVKPEAYNGNAAFLTKGDYQFGIIQSDAGAPGVLSEYRQQSAVCRAELPENWVKQWHHVAGIYDGNQNGALCGR